MKKSTIFLIRAYQRTFSPDHGLLRRAGIIRTGACVFYPTCSEYTIATIEKYGVLRGIARGIARVFRCHPWQKQRIDPAR